MSRKPLFSRLVAMLPLLIMVLLLHWCLPPVAVAAEPITTLTTGLQAAVAALGPLPAASNATSVLVVAQLNLDQASQPPFHIAPVPLNLAGSSIIVMLSSIQPTPAINCTVSSATLLTCTLTPAGATWGTGVMVFTIVLTATDGHSVTSSPLTLTVQ